MTRVIQLGAAAGLALVMVACGGSKGRTDGTLGTGAVQNDRAVGTAGEGGAEASDADRSFIEHQLADNEKEVELGQLAQQRASSTPVKDFGRMMMRDHGDAGGRLREAAGRAHVDATTSLDEARNAQAELSAANGTDFDRQYIDMMVSDHEKAVSDVQREAQDTANEAIKQWATQTLPALQKHLDEARKLQSTLHDQATAKKGGRKGW